MAKQGVSMSADVRSFHAALELYARATGKDMSDVLNHAAGNVALRAIGKTKKAMPSRMRTTATYDPDRRPSTYKSRFHYALSAKQNRPTDAGSVRRFFRRRRSSSGYNKAGFIQPARDFGKRTRLRPFPGGDAARGRGKKSRPSTHVAVIDNFADGADEVGREGVNAAMPFVVNDMVSFAVRRMQKTANRFSGR